MATSTISIPIDMETARVYAAAPAEEQRKLQILLALRLRELTSGPARPLKEVMEDIGTQAKEKGLTPEILESLLHGE